MFFVIKGMVYRKNFVEKNRFFSVDYLKIIELHVVHTDVTCSLSRLNNRGDDIYKKGQ